MANAKKVNLITLGCSKNLVDSEYLLRQLELNGFDVQHDADNFSKGTVIINTCGFINDAKEESIDTILRYAQAKEKGMINGLFVMGCLSERYKSSLPDEIQEVDAFFGVSDIATIVQKIGGRLQQEGRKQRFLTTPSHYAYLKIAEGCNRKCAFCSIPLIRGDFHSKSIEELVEEAHYLAENGVKELILIAQDLSSYGNDLGADVNLNKLVQELSKIEKIKWIRLHYLYPQQFSDKLMHTISNEPKICKYLDIPVQHINDKVLKQMRRGHNSSQTRELIARLRENIPGLSIRTTLLTGHPGEGEEEFDELMNFVKETKFDRLGVFAYSEEEDTFGAKNYQDILPNKIKMARAEAIMKAQEEISFGLNEIKVGREFTILIDRKIGNYYYGRTEHDSPEVDNEVLIPVNSTSIKPGSFVQARITAAENYELFAEIIA